MFLYLLVWVLLLPEMSLSNVLTTPWRGCPTCKGQTTAGFNTTTLDLGDPCGVYTQSCAHGLRCEPPQNESRPLRALLEGRGICSNISNTTTQVHNQEPVSTESPNEAPCRKLLTTLIKSLDSHLFKSHHDIYIPNCDKNGFFKKKQCWSSRGKKRGKCWCVGERGTPITPKIKQKGSLSC